MAKPGLYEVEAGTRLEEVLSQARPKRFADLSPHDPESRILASCQIQIKPLTELIIQVEGVGEVRVPPGTRICDLKKILSLHSAALKSRRLLKQGEKIQLDKN